jgi:hypothetical protein
METHMRLHVLHRYRLPICGLFPPNVSIRLTPLAEPVELQIVAYR